jgi:hypothetical protein
MGDNYTVPPGHSVDIETETRGGVQHTVVRIKKPDGSTEQTFTHITTLPSWWED